MEEKSEAHILLTYLANWLTKYTSPTGSTDDFNAWLIDLEDYLEEYRLIGIKALCGFVHHSLKEEKSIRFIGKTTVHDLGLIGKSVDGALPRTTSYEEDFDHNELDKFFVD